MRSGDLLFCAALSMSVLQGCTQKMGKDGHIRPYSEPRRIPPGTIARGHLKSMIDDPRLVRIPIPVNEELLKRGRERFDIYCAPCHGPAGYGDGMIVQRGFIHPPSYHSEQVRNLSDGDIYGVITNGFGRMYGYADRIKVEDRWAVVSYLRALQLSQGGQP